MGDHIRSKTKLGYHISTKIISILLVLLLTTTAFSSIITAQESKDSIRDKINKVIDKISGYVSDKTGDSGKGAAANAPASKTKFSDLFKELSILKRNRTSIFSVVTKYNGTETTTRLKLFLPTAIDVNDDGKKDIRVWIFRLPGIDLNPPAACIKTTLLVRRLNDDIKNGPFEIYLQWTPKVISKLVGSTPFHIKIGYQTPAGGEVPKTCIVTHKDIPHLLYPRLKTTQRISINPVSIVGKSQLNLLFSISNETEKSELTIQVNNSPAIKNEISFSLSKDHFIRRGQTLEISRKNVVPSNVSLFIKDVMGTDGASLTINNLPKKITLSWLLAPKGYIELNTHGSGTGKVEAAVNGAISLGFKPETGVNFRLGWDADRLTRIGALIGLSRGKSFDLTFDASASATLSDLYVDVPNFNLSGLIKPQKLKLTASLLSFNLKAGADAGKVVLKPYPGADTVAMNVENADVMLKDCNINLITVEPPTVSITYPQDGDTVRDVVTITGTASAPPSKTIKSVTISIDNGDSILVDGTTEWSYKWDTTALPNGNHTITAQVFDSESNSNKDTITVIVNNAEHKWRPSVKITAPSNLQILKGIVRIKGTANDVDGDKLTVNLTIINVLDMLDILFKMIEVNKVTVDEHGNWYYDLDTTSITSGLYTIYANSYDEKDDSNSDSVIVWIKLKCNLDFTLSKASINVTNFEVKYNSLGNITDLAVSSFVASGSGSLKVGGESVSLEVSGSLDVQDTSISKTNETSVTTTLLDDLDVNFKGYGSALLSKSAISLELNASIYIHAAGVLNIKNITFGLDGTASAKISFDESGKILLGEDKDHVKLDIKNLKIEAEGIISAGANRILFNGTGDISIVNNKLIVNGWLKECVLDNLYIDTDLGILYLSGSVNFSKTGTLSLEFAKSLSFNLSYTGESSLVITNAEFKIRSKSGNVSASADTVTIDTGGYVDFSYYKENADATCCINFSSICISSGLALTFDDRSLTVPFDICGSGSFKFSLLLDILIEYGPDWIRITIGGNGNAHIVAYATLSVAEKEGYLDVDIELVTGDETFVIYLYNLKSDNKGFNIDGSASVNLNKFDLVLRDKVLFEDIVNISVENLRVGFDLDASGENGSILLDIKEGGIALDKGHVYADIAGQFKFSLFGSVNMSTSSVGVSGTIEAKFNETALTLLNIDFNAYVHVDITGLDFRYIKYNKTGSKEASTDIVLSADQIFISGNGNIFITPEDYIHANINPSGDVAEFNLVEASINVTNFEIKLDDSLGNITDLAVSSFVASGSGSLVVSKDSISLETSGSLNIQDTSISITNETSVTTKLLDNLDMEFNGHGAVLLSKSAIKLELNASIYVHVDEMFGIKNTTFSLNGIASAKISFDESGKLILGEDKDRVMIDVKDLVIAIEGIISADADRIFFSGTGDISIINKKITLSSDSIECHIDDLSVNTDLGVFSISGNLDLSEYGEITAEFTNLFNLSVSYDGLTNLVITDFEFKVISSKGTAAISAKSVNIQPDGHAGISYYKDELEITCCIDVFGIVIDDLTFSFNESSYGPFDVTWGGSACFTLTSDVKIDFGSDWIRIEIGGKGRASLDIHTTIHINNYIGYLNAIMNLTTGDDTFVIYIYNLSSNIGFNVYGSAVLNLELFELYLENDTTDELLVDTSIENFMLGFDINSSMENGEITLAVNEAGISLDNGHVYININNKFNMSLDGTVDVAMSSNVSGVIKIEFNQTGMSDLLVDFTGTVNVEITDLSFSLMNTEKSTNILLYVDLISINGNANIVITPDYINASVGTVGISPGSDSKYAEGIVIENFSFNASIGSLGFNVIVNFDLLKIEDGISINIGHGIVIDASRDITASDLYLVVNYDPVKVYITLDLGLLEIKGGGKIVVDESFSLISGSGITDFVIKNTSLDVVIPDPNINLKLMLEDADISFVGGDVEFTVNLSGGLGNATIVADLSGDSYITVNTLWAFLSITYIEIRVKNLLISGPTVINIDADLARDELAVVKINAVDGIKADEFTIAGIINLYGVDGGPNVSIGVDKIFNILIGFDGLWHFDMLLLMNSKLLTNVDFDGKIDPLLLGFSSYWYHIEGDVGESSTISFNYPGVRLLSERKLVFELEPGIFAIDIDGLDTFSADPISGPIGFFGYTDFPITIKLLTLTGETLPILQDVVGYIELTLDINSFLTLLGDDERDIDVSFDIKGNIDRAKILGIGDINGSGDAHIDFQASGSIGNNLYAHLSLNWAGTRYVTYPEFLRFAFAGAGQWDHSIGFNPDSGDYLVETNQLLLVMNQNTQYVTISDLEGNVMIQGNMQIYQNGEIEIKDTRGDAILGPSQNENLVINGVNIMQQLHNIFDKVYLWIWNPFNENWVRIPLLDTRPAPVVKGAVTLLSRKASGATKNELHVSSWEILPGTDYLNFTAWYKPGPNNHGPYDFVFNYGDGSPSETVYVSASQVPIKICSLSNHNYTAPGKYIATVTVIDHGNSGDTATDTFTVNVVEKYLRVSPDNGKTQWSGSGTFPWDFEKISEELGADGKLHGSFEVMNVANETYSPGYTLVWNITGYDNMKYGTNWTFDRKNGVLGPGENQTVNFSFVPPSIPGDYDPRADWYVYVNNVNNPGERVMVDFDIWYGLVEVLPDSKQTLYVEKGNSATFDNLFWVFSNRWEELDWVISNVTFNDSFDPSLITYSLTPNEGVIHPGDPLTPISLYIDASNEAFTGCTMKVKVQRQGNDINSTADNDTINISIRLTDFGGGGSDPGSEWITPDDHVQNWWFYPRRAHDDNLNSWSASSYRRLHGGWTGDPLILTLSNTINCNGFRINAKAGDNLDQLEVKLYYGITLQFTKTFTAGQWNNYDWTEWNSPGGTTKTVNRAEIRMHLSSGTFKGHWAVVREFDFKEDT